MQVVGESDPLALATARSRHRRSAADIEHCPAGTRTPRRPAAGSTRSRPAAAALPLFLRPCLHLLVQEIRPVAGTEITVHASRVAVGVRESPIQGGRCPFLFSGGETATVSEPVALFRSSVTIFSEPVTQLGS